MASAVTTTTTTTIYTPFTNYSDASSTVTTYLTLNGKLIGTYSYQKGQEVSTGKITYIHTNYLGTPVLETDDRGDIVQIDITDVFGNYVVRDQRKDNAYHNKGYTSHEFDDVTGLTYAHARYLDTRMHSFMSVDPMLYRLPESYLIDPQQMNSYAYARNNPITYTDPTGEFANLISAGIGAVLGGIIGGVTAARKDQNILTGIGVGAATGAVAGLTFGASLAATAAVGFGGGTLIGTVAAGTMAGMTGYITDRTLTGNSMSTNGILSAGAGGAATAGVLKGTGSAVSSLLGKGAGSGSSGYNVSTVGPTTQIGGFNSSNVSQYWVGTNMSVENSMAYHLNKHGQGLSIEKYTQKAFDFFGRYSSSVDGLSVKSVDLKTTPTVQGIKIKDPLTGESGIYNQFGKIVTYILPD